MIRLSQQELEICYILSRIFNYCTSYAEILGDINQDVANYKTGEKHYARYTYLVGKEKCFALFRVRRKYKQVAREIKAIKSDFTQKDLDRLFPIVALYCMKTPLFYDELEVWAMEEGWDREEFMQGIVKIKNISYLRKKYIDFRVKSHYKILCCVFGFTQHSLEEQKQILKRDSSIHFPTKHDKYMYTVCCIAFILVLIMWVVRIMG
ncbi:hypothetical protein [Helicobacter trogontum]|uniref:Uncharacterized protein n=1 Tax=Helicobacter trogontum TaxID=50960 RepID=A0A4U8S2W0_9HELI|nr:hypothetical protein [Helicobacter trogontum]TLD80068.1 hypothetical protein LS81_009805 [Helicobacter trogontum]